MQKRTSWGIARYTANSCSIAHIFWKKKTSAPRLTGKSWYWEANKSSFCYLVLIKGRSFLDSIPWCRLCARICLWGFFGLAGCLGAFSYRKRRSVPGISTQCRHSPYRVSKCSCSNRPLMCAGNSHWNYHRDGNRSRRVGTGYCNLYRYHHKLCRIGVFREIHRISSQGNRLLTE